MPFAKKKQLLIKSSNTEKNTRFALEANWQKIKDQIMGANNTDQQLVYFYLVAETCPTNSNQFEFVGQVTGTKFEFP